MRIFTSFLVMALVSSAVSAAVPLFERAGGAAYYDSNQDITWLTDANYAATSGTDLYEDPTDGFMRRSYAYIWIDNLNAAAHLGITTWRMPELIDIENDGYQWYPCNEQREHDVGEMGFLYYEILGGVYRVDCDNNPQPHGLTYHGPFINIVEDEHEAYWYGTPYVGEQPEGWDQGWAIHFAYGGTHNDGGAGPVWPVFDGDLLYTDGDPLPFDVVNVQPNDPDNFVKTDGDFSDQVHVAIEGSAELDATQVDSSTVRFGPADVSPHIIPGVIRDRNNDGYDDMTLRFRIADTGLGCGLVDQGVTLSGETNGGLIRFAGSDVVTTSECVEASCHP
jgi:hypothetical protein